MILRPNNIKYKMKSIYLLSLLLIVHVAAFSQTTGTIRGTVKTSDGNPAEYVNVGIEGTTKGTVAGRNGAFEIKHIIPGNYILVASFVGLESQKQNIEVKAGEVTTVEFALNETSHQLQEVIVSAHELLNKEDNYVAKTPLKKMENPQTYNSVSTEILKQQAVTRFDDAFRNVPGVFRTWESTGRDGDGAAFFALRGLEGQPSLVNGLPGITNGNLDPANIEEIQVLKGPSATLFGANATAYSNYGGLINTITKKPYFKTGGEISYNIGSFALNRIAIDVNTPLSKEEKIAVRVTGAYHYEGSFQDAGFRKSIFIAPSLAYEVNDRLKVLIVTEILQEERAVAPVFFHTNRADELTFRNVEELNLDPNLSFTSNDLTIKNPRMNFQGQMTYKLSDNWTSQTVISRGSAESDGYYTYIWPDLEGDNWFGQYYTYVKQSRVTTDIQQNFNGDFNIGSVRNRVLFGLDYFHRQATNNGLGYVFVRNVTPQGDQNFIDPYSGDELDPVFLSRASIDNLLSTTPVGNSKVSNGAFSVYLSDAVNITPGLLLLASIRADYFDFQGEKSNKEDDFDQVAWSPRFGIVYQPIIDKLSIFANYQNSFNNVAPLEVADPDGSNPRLKSFDPEQANQFEAGIKTNLFKDKLIASVSYYNIVVSNKVIGDATNFYNSVQGGEVESKGFELDVASYPVNGMTLIVGLSHNRTENLSGNDGDFYGEPGRVPGGQGPQNQANFWLNYKFPAGAIKDFGFGIGGNYVSEYRVADNSVVGTFDLPAYSLLNASLFYNPEKFRFSVNVNNVTDKQYYIGYWSVNPQRPRELVISMSYKF
jgi:iron complex outermembrane receptor protein